MYSAIRDLVFFQWIRLWICMHILNILEVMRTDSFHVCFALFFSQSPYENLLVEKYRIGMKLLPIRALYCFKLETEKVESLHVSWQRVIFPKKEFINRSRVQFTRWMKSEITNHDSSYIIDYKQPYIDADVDEFAELLWPLRRYYSLVSRNTVQSKPLK